MRTPSRKFEAHPTLRVSGTVVVPGDKSISHRALMLSGIAEGTSEVTGFLASEDCLATLTAMRALGVRIEQPSPTHVVIHGVGLRGLRDARRTLDMGNAGTAMRLFTGLLSAQAFDSQLIGDASLMKRPMERVAKPLREMGADVRTHGGRPPVDVTGKTVILVDDGLATGASMLAAVRAVRPRAREVMVAVPVAAQSTCNDFRHEVDHVVCARVQWPFYSVGSFYRNFEQTTDAEVCSLLQASDDRAKPAVETISMRRLVPWG